MFKNSDIINIEEVFKPSISFIYADIDYSSLDKIKKRNEKFDILLDEVHTEDSLDVGGYESSTDLYGNYDIICPSINTKQINLTTL